MILAPQIATAYTCRGRPLLMRPQELTSPCAFGGGGSTVLLDNGALSALRQGFMHPRQHTTMLSMRGASTSGNRSRVRRTVLVPECGGAAVAPVSPFGTRLASAVMAGDENMEQLSRMRQRGDDAALGDDSGRRRRRSWRHEGQGRRQEDSRRDHGRGRGGIDTAAGATLAASPKMQVCYIKRRLPVRYCGNVRGCTCTY